MKDRIEWTRMVSDCITGYRSAKGDADALPPRTFIRAWMNRNFGLQKIPGRLFRLFYRSDKEELNEAFKAGNRARKQESAADAVQGTDDAGPRGQLTRWAAEIVKAVNEASAESRIWTAENFGDNIEIADSPSYDFYEHTRRVDCWSGCIDDFEIDFDGGYVAGYIFIYVPVNPEDGYAFLIGGACNGEDVNESYGTYNTLEEAISGSIEEIIGCIEYWNGEVAENDLNYSDDEWDENEDIDEAFRTGNQARKKEAAADAVQGMEYIHYVDDPFLNIQMNRLKEFIKPDDVTHLTGNCIKFYVDVPCDFEFFFKVTISSLDVYTVSVMFNVEGLETWMYNAEDMMDEEDLEKVFDRIVNAVEHPEEFEEYREGGYNG